MNLKQWSVVAAIVAAAVVPQLLFGRAQSSTASTGQASPPAVSGRSGRTSIVSPEIGSDRSVTFRLRAPAAQDVALLGIGARRPMNKDAQGLWSVTTEPLAPDIYTYQFSIEGASFPDPSNTQLSGANASGVSSILSIPGATWTYGDVPHGAVAKQVYQSSIIGGTETFYVYTPPNYDPHRKQPYPVLYLLHGLGDEALGWIANGGAPATIDNLIAQHEVEPMILVSPTSYGNTGGTRAAAAGFPNFTRALIEEIMPIVQKQYDASSKRSDNAITGLSMGAAQSLLLLNHLDRFAWIGSFSPGFDMYSPTWGQPASGAVGRVNPVAPPTGAPASLTMRPVLADGNLDQTFPSLDAKASAQIKLLYVVCGTADDHLNLTRQFKSFLDQRNIKVTYVEVPGATHSWPLWRDQLGQFAQKIFK